MCAHIVQCVTRVPPPLPEKADERAARMEGFVAFPARSRSTGVVEADGDLETGLLVTPSRSPIRPCANDGTDDSADDLSPAA